MRSGSTISSGRDFRRVYAEGIRCRRDGLTVVARAGAEPTRPARLGLSVPARVGSAVVRNRLRRRLREAFRAAAPAPGFDVVVRADPEAAGRTFREVSADLRAALVKVGVAR